MTVMILAIFVTDTPKITIKKVIKPFNNHDSLYLIIILSYFLSS